MVIDVRDDGDLMKDRQLGWTMTFERLRGQRSDNLASDYQNKDKKAIKDDTQIFSLDNCWQQSLR